MYTHAYNSQLCSPVIEDVYGLVSPVVDVYGLVCPVVDVYGLVCPVFVGIYWLPLSLTQLLVSSSFIGTHSADLKRFQNVNSKYWRILIVILNSKCFTNMKY